MRNRLPLELENLELPNDNFKRVEKQDMGSSGYVSILSLISLIITLGTVLTVIFLGNR